jgi:two-component system response regulator AtoC
MTSDDEATETVAWREARPRVIAVWSGGSAFRPLPDRGSIVIGRGGECDLHIDDKSVSRAHATLTVHPEAGLTIEDLGSSNGTRLAGKTIAPHVPSAVRQGEIVDIGAARVLVEGHEHRRDPGSNPTAAPPRDGPMDRVRRLVELVAPSDISVVLCGETGVGKELTAESIHQLSSRAKGPMVRINCAALSESLFESELFGHERGAFTGAIQAKAGILEGAGGGTLLLDEVAELTMGAQAKLLRALETREVLRVGGLRPRTVDVRFVAATNRDLKAQCERSQFRSDLYFRLNGMTILIPPLRERVGEIRELAAALIERQCARSGRPAAVLTPDAVDHLERHRWPGNVRELRNVIERALVLCPGSPIGREHLALDPPDLPAAAEAAAAPQSLKRDLAALERQRIVGALAQCGGNQTKAARLLGISRRTLLTRMDEWGLPRPRK